MSMHSNTHATANQSNLPKLVADLLNSPAAALLDAEAEAALARAIMESRATVWESLAAVANTLGGHAPNLAELVASSDTDQDDEALPIAVALALETVDAHASKAPPESPAHAEAEARANHIARSWLDEATTAARSLKRAKDSLFKHNMRLCVSEARKQHKVTGGILPMADLIQEGSIGLIKAVCRFDHRLGLRFTTYALWWVDHHVQRAIADKAREIRLPVHIADKRGKIIKAKRALTTAGVADPTPDQIARECIRRTLTIKAERASKAAEMSGTPAPLPPTAADVDAACKAKGALSGVIVAKALEAIGIACVSGNTPVGNAYNDPTRTEVLDMFTDESPDAVEVLAEGDMSRVLASALATLPERTADAIRRHFGALGADEMTLAEVGEVYGLRGERIRQIEVKGIASMRKELLRRGVDGVASAGCGA
jgi:RNA polymerase primary sigma factor